MNRGCLENEKIELESLIKQYVIQKMRIELVDTIDIMRSMRIHISLSVVQ